MTILGIHSCMYSTFNNLDSWEILHEGRIERQHPLHMLKECYGSIAKKKTLDRKKMLTGFCNGFGAKSTSRRLALLVLLRLTPNPTHPLPWPEGRQWTRALKYPTRRRRRRKWGRIWGHKEAVCHPQGFHCWISAQPTNSPLQIANVR